MLCLIAWVVFGILGLFSVKYRVLAKESFNCVFRRMTFKKCNSNLDERIKSKLTGNLMKFSPKMAKGVYRHYEFISWIFVALFVVSMVFTAQGAYNLIMYDNCAGPDANPDQCIFTPDYDVVSCDDPLCADGHCEECGDDCDCDECL